MTNSLPVGRQFEVYVEGTPVPQGSLNGYLRAGRVILTHSNAADLKRWRKHVGNAIKARWDYTGQGAQPYRAAHLALVFYMPRPKSHTKRQRADTDHMVKPDLDKLVRAILDAIPETVLVDDSRVSWIRAHKVYEDAGSEPGVHILMKEI